MGPAKYKAVMTSGLSGGLPSSSSSTGGDRHQTPEVEAAAAVAAAHAAVEERYMDIDVRSNPLDELPDWKSAFDGEVKSEAACTVPPMPSWSQNFPVLPSLPLHSLASAKPKSKGKSNNQY